MMQLRREGRGTPRLGPLRRRKSAHMSVRGEMAEAAGPAVSCDQKRDGDVYDGGGWPAYRTGLHLRLGAAGQRTLTFGLRADRPLPPGVEIAIGETVILLHPPLPLAGVSIGLKRGVSSK